MSVKNNRPRGLINPQGVFVPDSFGEEAFRGEYSGDNLIYAAFARPGANEDENVWQLSRISYSGSNPISIQWPVNSEGAVTNDYEFSWTDRATYTYL